MIRLKKIKSNSIFHGSSPQSNKYVYKRLEVLENITDVLAKATFNDLQALKNRINKPEEDFNILSHLKIMSSFSNVHTATMQNYMFHSLTLQVNCLYKFQFC